MRRRVGKKVKEEMPGDRLVICSGSITVFLTILFLLFFALIGVTLENVRILSSEGYMRVAAHSAAMTAFGAYNRELYRDYGLFAFGGCEGKGIEDLAEEFTGILAKNIQCVPDEQRSNQYVDLYRISAVKGEVANADLLTDSNVFLKQIGAYLKSTAVQDLTGEIRNKVSGNAEDSSIKEKLALTQEYEEGKFNAPKKQGAGERDKLPGRKAALKGDKAKGNPLEVFTDLMRDGVLSLVCNVRELSDGVIPDSSGKNASDFGSGKQKKDNMGAADYLRSLLDAGALNSDFSETDGQAGEMGDSEGMEKGQDVTEGGEAEKMPGKADENVVKKGWEKTQYICYANKQFSSYTEQKARTTKYGLEYLAAGKREEKDSLSHVVNKILVIRLLLNFGCIVADPVLQEKSLITATILAGFTGLPPVISAVQYTILLILAFEEACIDLTALLEGRQVPIAKGAGQLKMRYEEICLASKSLFAAKAKEYSRNGKSAVADITYNQYLWFFLLVQSVDKLRDRSYDLIQHDLREKYNQTFTIRTCICRSRYQVKYQIPFLFPSLPYLNEGRNGNMNTRQLEVDYEYESR